MFLNINICTYLSRILNPLTNHFPYPRQVVDERTPLAMPSVAQIQNYLDSASDPTVVRHDGKMKTPGKSCATNQNKSYIPRRVNQSLADLSLASGDVSLYTIKDAKKF